jgi:NADH-quinone oxidoreductase subunit N
LDRGLSGNFLLVMACVIALFDLGIKSPMRADTYVCVHAAFTGCGCRICRPTCALSGTTIYGFGNMVVSDAMGNWLKCFATVAVMVTLVYGRPYAAHRDMLRGGELFT